MRSLRTVVAVVALVLALPGTAMAQIPFPPRVADSVAECVTGNIPALLSEAAFTEPIDNGWRVVIPLSAQPPEPMAQQPPPTVDELSWIELYLFPSVSSAPAGINNFDTYLVQTQTGGGMLVMQDGYYMPILRHVGQLCVEYATGGTFVPR